MSNHKCPVKETCLGIDNVKSEIESIIGYLKDLSNDLEIIRAENIRLRKWGYDQRKRADDLESDNEQLKKQ